MLKMTLLTLILFSSCATETALIRPLTKKSFKKTPKVYSSPKDLITDFYEEHFSDPQNSQAPLSSSLTKLNLETEEICKIKAKNEICGWMSQGDPFLDAQDYSDKLTLKSSQFKAEQLRANKIKVSFNIFPDLANKDQAQREITYLVIKEKNLWAIDDVIYNKNRSARKTLIETQKRLEEKSFSLAKILRYTKIEKLKTNIKSIQKDVSFNSYKTQSKNLTLNFKAYPGPERFNQLSLQCDQCQTSEISLDQTLLCQSSFKSLYKTVVSTKNYEELNTLFKQARFEERVKIDLPKPGHLLRVESGDLKCDGLSGKQLRIDLFIQ